MSIPSTILFEVRATGSASNGSGFNPENSNFPTDGAATSATGTAPVFSSASYTFVAGDVGAWIYIKSGTNWVPGFYKIASVATGAATLNATAGAGVYYYDINTQFPSTANGCATTASPTGATWGIDYSQQDTAQFAFTDLVIGGTTTQLTSAAHPVGKNFVGNLIQITSGTGFTAATYEIVSTSGTTATCDSSLGTGGSTAGHGNLGGAGTLDGVVGSQMLDQCGLWILQGTHTSSGNCPVFSGSSYNRYFGYAAVRGDAPIDNTRPLIQPNGTPAHLLGAVCHGNKYAWLRLDSQGTSAMAILTYDACVVRECKISNVASNHAVQLRFSATVFRCEFTGCTDAAYNCLNLIGGNTYIGKNYFHGNEQNSIYAPIGGPVERNVISGGAYGIVTTNYSAIAVTACVRHNSIYNCTLDGIYSIDATAGNAIPIQDNILVSNGGYGIVVTGSGEVGNIADYHNFFYNNTSGPRGGYTHSTFPGDVILSGNPFTNAAGGDFSLNNTAGAGAAVRAAGLAAIGQSDYPDGGALQHQDSGGSSGMLYIPNLEGI